MIKDTSVLSIDNFSKGDVIGIFVSDIGEIICSINNVGKEDITVDTPYRLVMQESQLGLAPIGNIPAIVEQEQSQAPTVSIPKNSIIYFVNVPQELSDAYSEKVSSITIARGDVNSVVNSQK